MCNEAYRRRQIGEIASDWAETRVPLRFPERLPNLPAQESVRITDRAPIIRAAVDGVAEMVVRRWSWPMTHQGTGAGKPVYNFRSDGRTIAGPSRCLIPVDGFYEFTDPPPSPPDAPKPKGKPPKSKWAFTLNGHGGFAIAGIWRADADVGEAWAMLTCPPGPDIAPYHSRQVVVIRPDDYVRWLDPAVPSTELCRPLSAGSLLATQVR